MQTSAHSNHAHTPGHQALDLVRRQARELHRRAQSDSLATALPVLRRLIATDALVHSNLSALFHDRANVRRKHLLRTLAKEAGFADWKSYRDAVLASPDDTLERLQTSRSDAATLKLWFRDVHEAQAYADEHGGKVVRVGRQAVIRPDDRA